MATVGDPITFRIGYEHGHTLPILLRFSQGKNMLFPSRWNIADSRTIALSLLKYVEIAERAQRAESALTNKSSA